jgi:hypothetical protein
MKKLIYFFLALAPMAGHAGVRVTVMLPTLQVAKANVNVFSTPIVFLGDAVYTINVEPPHWR